MTGGSPVIRLLLETEKFIARPMSTDALHPEGKNLGLVLSQEVTPMRPEAMTGMARAAVRVKHAFGSYDGDPMPKALIVSSLVLSGVSLCVGIALGWEGLTSNVAANLLILGPGLLITNILVGAWRDDRLAKQVEPLINYIVRDLSISLVTAADFSKKVGVPYEAPVISQGEGFPSVVEITRITKSLEDAHGAVDSLNSMDFPAEVRVTSDLLKIADLSLVVRFVSHLNSICPVPDALMLATVGAHGYDNHIFRTVTELRAGNPVSSFNRIGHTERGFGSLRRAAFEYNPDNPNVASIYIVSVVDYANFLLNILRLSSRILDEILKNLPNAILVRLETGVNQPSANSS